jgi:hypothetical protein
MMFQVTVLPESAPVFSRVQAVSPVWAALALASIREISAVPAP